MKSTTTLRICARSLLIVLALSGCASPHVKNPQPDPASSPGATHAAEQPPPRAVPDPRYARSRPRLDNPCGQRLVEDEEFLDQSRRQIEEAACDLTLWFDGLFGGRVASDIASARRISGNLEVLGFHSEFSGSTLKFRFQIRADLPNLEQRVSVFASRDNQEDFVRDRSESEALRTRFPRLNDKYDTIAGLGYALPARDWLLTKFQVGLSLRQLQVPTAFVHVRFDMNAYADEFNLIHLGATPFYNSLDHFGLTTNIDYTHVLTPTVLVRWASSNTYSQNSAGLDWRSAWILYHAMGSKRGIAYETFIRGATRAPVPVGEYGAKVLYRQPIAQERLIGEVILGYSFPQDDPLLQRMGAVGVGLNVSLPFGPRIP